MSKIPARVRILKGSNEDERIFALTRATCWHTTDSVTIRGYFTDTGFKDHEARFGLQAGVRTVVDSILKDWNGVTKVTVQPYLLTFTKTTAHDWSELEPIILTAIAAGIFKDENLWEVQVEDRTRESEVKEALASRIIAE